MVTKNLDYYRKLRYKYVENISRNEEGGHTWLVHIDELPECVGDGISRPAAFYKAQESFLQFIQEAIRLERDIPEPIEVRKSPIEAINRAADIAVTIEDTVQINDILQIETEIEDYELISIEPFLPNLSFDTFTSFANEKTPIINEAHLA